jgi:predicted HTH domain antitoxin
MTFISLSLPDDLSTALHVPAEGLGAEIAFAAAARLYEEGRVSLAKAAEIAGLERFTFSARLAASGIATATFDVSDVDVARAAAR